MEEIDSDDTEPIFGRGIASGYGGFFEDGYGCGEEISQGQGSSDCKGYGCSAGDGEYNWGYGSGDADGAGRDIGTGGDLGL